MSSVINEKHVKTRKLHTCVYCGRLIPAGTSGVRHEWGIYEGEPFNIYTCPKCDSYDTGREDDSSIYHIYHDYR